MLDPLTSTFLAHQSKISDILSWVGKCILPRRENERTFHCLYCNSCTWPSSDVIVMLKWRHHVTSQRTQGLLEVYFKIKSQWRARKRIHYSWERDRKIRPLKSTFVITRQASRCQAVILWDGFFYPILTIMIDSYMLKIERSQGRRTSTISSISQWFLTCTCKTFRST